MSESSIQFGSEKIVFDVIKCARSTLAISVHPNMRVSVVAPQHASIEQVLDKVRNRAAWILKQQRFFLNLAPNGTPKRFVSGESFRYLGRQYRLKIVVGKTQGVNLKPSVMHVTVRGVQPQREAHTAVTRWYRARAQIYFEKKLADCLSRFPSLKVSHPKLQIKKMSSRWGSCTTGGVIVLNSELIQAPSHCIDYVICHELTHLKVRNHTPAFFKMLSMAMPDWESRRRRLSQFEF